jgi:hypothetical protein
LHGWTLGQRDGTLQVRDERDELCAQGFVAGAVLGWRG